MGGVVFLAPDLRTAIKIHHQASSYATEVEAYKRIVRAGLTKVRGFTIPTPRPCTGIAVDPDGLR